MSMTGRLEGFWSRLYHAEAEAFGHERQLCADLRAVGVDANIAQHGQPKLIRIKSSPIRWVRVLAGSGGATGDFVVYGVPDSRQLPAVQVSPKWEPRENRLCWQSEGEGTEIALRLNEFDVINSTIVAGNLEAIETFPPENSWLIVQRCPTWDSPTVQWYQWSACEKIAEILRLTPLKASPN